MDKDTQRIREAHWREIILAVGKSGFTKAEWCRQNGVSLDSLYYWQHKLRVKDAELLKSQTDQETPQVPAMGSHGVVSASSSFVEITPNSSEQMSSSEEKTQPTQQSFVPELVLQEGKFQLLIGSTTTRRTLAMVLKAIADA